MKLEADDLLKIDIYWLKRYGYLNGNKRKEFYWERIDNKIQSIEMTIQSYPFLKYLLLEYKFRQNNDKKNEIIKYKIPFTYTKCNYGGKRYWFICPGSCRGYVCGRRVAKLYLGGKYFLCRHCYNLSYRSRNHNTKKYKLINLLCRHDEITRTIKKRCYQGEPTKKHKQIEKITSKLGLLVIGS